jgi:ribosome-associated translation inhibitor RaiA
MKESISTKIEKLTRQAKDHGKKVEVKVPVQSSLHHVIKSKQQADLFMKLLKEA